MSKEAGSSASSSEKEDGSPTRCEGGMTSEEKAESAGVGVLKSKRARDKIDKLD